MKDLIHRGKLYGRYEVSGSVLYLKMICEIYPGDSLASEEWLRKTICAREAKEFKYISYLNTQS